MSIIRYNSNRRPLASGEAPYGAVSTTTRSVPPITGWLAPYLIPSGLYDSLQTYCIRKIGSITENVTIENEDLIIIWDFITDASEIGLVFSIDSEGVKRYVGPVRVALDVTDFAYARTVAGVATVFSDTISTTNTNLSGRISSIAVFNLPEQISFKILPSFIPMQKFKTINVPLFTGTTLLAKPFYHAFSNTELDQTENIPFDHEVIIDATARVSNTVFEVLTQDLSFTLSSDVVISIEAPQANTEVKVQLEVDSMADSTAQVSSTSRTLTIQPGVPFQVDNNRTNQPFSFLKAITVTVVEDVPNVTLIVRWRQDNPILRPNGHVKYITWVQGSLGDKNINISGSVQYEFIPRPDFMRQGVLDKPLGSTFEPIEAFNAYLSDDTFPLRLVYTNQQYKEFCEFYLNLNEDQELDQRGLSASFMGRASVFDIIKKIAKKAVKGLKSIGVDPGRLLHRAVDYAQQNGYATGYASPLRLEEEESRRINHDAHAYIGNTFEFDIEDSEELLNTFCPNEGFNIKANDAPTIYEAVVAPNPNTQTPPPSSTLLPYDSSSNQIQRRINGVLYGTASSLKPNPNDNNAPYDPQIHSAPAVMDEQIDLQAYLDAFDQPEPSIQGESFADDENQVPPEDAIDAPAQQQPQPELNPSSKMTYLQFLKMSALRREVSIVELANRRIAAQMAQPFVLISKDETQAAFGFIVARTRPAKDIQYYRIGDLFPGLSFCQSMFVDKNIFIATGQPFVKQAPTRAKELSIAFVLMLQASNWKALNPQAAIFLHIEAEDGLAYGGGSSYFGALMTLSYKSDPSLIPLFDFKITNSNDPKTLMGYPAPVGNISSKIRNLYHKHIQERMNDAASMNIDGENFLTRWFWKSMQVINFIPTAFVYYRPLDSTLNEVKEIVDSGIETVSIDYAKRYPNTSFQVILVADSPLRITEIRTAYCTLLLGLPGMRQKLKVEGDYAALVEVPQNQVDVNDYLPAKVVIKLIKDKNIASINPLKSDPIKAFPQQCFVIVDKMIKAGKGFMIRKSSSQISVTTLTGFYNQLYSLLTKNPDMMSSKPDVYQAAIDKYIDKLNNTSSVKIKDHRSDEQFYDKFFGTRNYQLMNRKEEAEHFDNPNYVPPKNAPPQASLEFKKYAMTQYTDPTNFNVNYVKTDPIRSPKIAPQQPVIQTDNLAMKLLGRKKGKT